MSVAATVGRRAATTYRVAVEELDLLIVGSGSGNTIPGPDLDGWRIGIAEQGTFGGTCLNVGCIPSKMLVLPADRVVEAADASRLGVHLPSPTVDWPAIRDRVAGRIDPISAGGRAYRAGQDDVVLLEGHAEFTASGTVTVGDTEVRAERVVLATGSRPYVPPLPGLADAGFHTSDTIMRVDRIPERLLVLGGGYIAAELGHVFAALGSEVVVVTRGERLLRAEDHEVSERFTSAFGRRAELHLSTRVDAVRSAGGEVALECTTTSTSGNPTPTVVSGDALLVCTGRVPNSDRLGLEHTSVRTSPDGLVVTDRFLRTDQPGVWAIGDVRSAHQLKHVANHEATVVTHNLLHPDDLRAVDESAVPHAVFSDPQVGAVGLREEDLRASGTPYRVGRRDYAGVAFGWALEDDTGFAKVLVSPGDRQILGGHVLGPQAATLVQLLTAAMQFAVPADRFAREQLWCHPALSEVVENALLDALD